MIDRLPPLVIVGPTAAGKSSLALALAERTRSATGEGLAVELVSADAMAVYRGMDIGTAKPDRAEQRAVAHHLIDVVDPGEEFDVARFKMLADEAIAAIESRGRSVVVVGGTGLYVRALVDRFEVPPKFPEVAAGLEAEDDTAVLWARLDRLDPAAAAKMNPTNRRRIVRALEVTEGSGRPFSSYGPGVDHYPETRFRLAGLEIERDEMDRRIDERYDHQIEAGFLDEVRALPLDRLSRTASQALGYRELIAHLAGELSLAEALTEAKRRTRRFARRQQRWFRRDPRIEWFDALAPDLVDRVDRWWRNPRVG